MLSYPSSMQVSNRALTTLAAALRHRRTILGSRWRRLSAARQALLVLAHLRKGETYTALAGGFGVGTTTVYRYVREGLDVLAAVAPTLNQALEEPSMAPPPATPVHPKSTGPAADLLRHCLSLCGGVELLLEVKLHGVDAKRCSREKPHE